MPQKCVELGCKKQAIYNYPGKPKPIFCKDHTDFENGMVNVRDKKCRNFSLCGNIAVLNGLCTSCSRAEGWDEIRYPCTKCGKKSAVGGLNGLCASCFNTLHKIVPFLSQKRLYKFLKNKFPEISLKSEVRILNFRPDNLMELSELYIVIENDENAHKHTTAYPKEDETNRQNQIYEFLSAKNRTVFIRFNCGNKKTTEEEIERRQNALEDLISDCLFDENISGIHYLFYDE